MPQSNWICNACGREFDTKGKPDGHQEQEHCQGISNAIENKGMNHSGNGKFICKCGRAYMAAQSFPCHQRSCTDVGESMDEGMF